MSQPPTPLRSGYVFQGEITLLVDMADTQCSPYNTVVLRLERDRIAK